MPPTLLVLLAVTSVQFGAAMAKSLFDEIGAGGTVFLRVLFAALVLGLIWRPPASCFCPASAARASTVWASPWRYWPAACGLPTS